MWCASSNSAACWPRPAPRTEHAGGYNAAHSGDVGEWFNPAVLKTADPQGSVSSNLTVSARTSRKTGPRGPFSLSTHHSTHRRRWHVVTPCGTPGRSEGSRCSCAPGVEATRQSILHLLARYFGVLLTMGNPPEKPKFPEVEFSKKEVLREEVEIYRQPDHGCLEAS